MKIKTAITVILACLIFSTVSMANICVVYNNCLVQFADQTVAVTVTVGGKSVTKTFSTENDQVSVTFQRNGKYEIAIHKKGTKWWKKTMETYTVSTKTMKTIEEIMIVNWDDEISSKK